MKPRSRRRRLGVLLLVLAVGAAPVAAEEATATDAAVDALIEGLSNDALSKAELRTLMQAYAQLRDNLTDEQRAAAERAAGAAFARYANSLEVPLVIAARDGDLAVARAELAKGVPPDTRMGNETALMNASLQGYAEIAQLLLAANADPSLGIHEQTSWTALEFAAMNGRLDTLELLLARDPPADRLQQALFTAAAQGHPKTLERIAAAGADVAAPAERGATPLMLAAQRGHSQTIAVLAELGADVDARDANGRTALMLAAWLGEGRAVAALLAAGAKPELADARGARAFPADTAASDYAATTASSHFLAKAHPEACPQLMGYAMVYRKEGGVAGGAYGLPRRPEPGTKAWVALQGGPLADVKVLSCAAAEYPEGTWTAELSVAPDSHVALAADATQASGVLLWPASASKPRPVPLVAGDAPFGIFPESVQVAVDTDADGRADVLELEYCCKAGWRSDGCEYTCGSYWQRTETGWAQCEYLQPE